MITLYGAGVGTEIAIGKAYVIDRSQVIVHARNIEPENLASEIAVLDFALQNASNSLKKARDEVPKNAPQEIVAFLDAHLLMIEDPMLREMTVEIMRNQLVDAETALMFYRNQIVEIFEQMEDDYLRSKKNDVDQVIQQIQISMPSRNFGSVETFEENLDGQILVAHDLTPADAVELMNKKMSAFVTNLGSPISHVAILARSLQIPAIVGLHGAIKQISHGVEIAVDSARSIVIVEPDEVVRKELEYRRLEHDRHQLQLLGLRDLRPRTLDGHEVSLLANVELPADIESAVKVGAKGVGLYRTEYLFMNQENFPSEEVQVQAYGKVVQVLGNVTIRTMDLGADKQVDGGRAQRNVAMNPALGIRAVRFCLQYPDLFLTQLRAILRVSTLGKVQIMIPMLSTLDEIGQVLGIIGKAKNELDREGYQYDPSIPIGGMIEVPSAAIAADQFAQNLDFLSIGTNDLIQYTLAIDRVDDEVNYLYDPLNPAVLRLIKHTIESGARFNKPVSLCGELASDALYTRLLLGIGLKIFSMDPQAIPEIKHVIRKTAVNQIHSYVQRIIECQGSAEQFQLLLDMNEVDSYLAESEMAV